MGNIEFGTGSEENEKLGSEIPTDSLAAQDGETVGSEQNLDDTRDYADHSKEISGLASFVPTGEPEKDLYTIAGICDARDMINCLLNFDGDATAALLTVSDGLQETIAEGEESGAWEDMKVRREQLYPKRIEVIASILDAAGVQARTFADYREEYLSKKQKS